MALSESKIKGCIKRLLLSRMRILYNHGFYGLLLMHMIYAVSEEIETACTDGVRITFGIDFLDSLSDSELDFVMMHEILHVVLQHCFRGDVEDPEAYNIAADIVVNSNIMLENGMKASSITLSKYGTSMHVAPDGKEGHEYTAEQVYVMLPKNLNKKGNNKSHGSADGRAKKGNNKSPGSAVGRAKKEISKEQHQPVRVWDDHSRWGKYEEDDTLRDVWVKRFEDAAEAIKIRDPSNARGLLPAFAERILKELKKTQTDWRTILNDFIQEEVVGFRFNALALLRFRIIHPKGLHGNGFDFLLIQRTILIIRVFLGNAVYHIHTFGDFAKACVSAVQMRSSLVHNEELASGRVGMHSSCHGENTLRVAQIILETVLIKFSFDGISRAAHAGSVRAAALNHKAIDDTVKDEAIIEAFFYKTDEIVYCIGGDFRI